MINVLGFQHGHFGDVVMATIAARAVKEEEDAHVTLNINKRFVAIKDIFAHSNDVDDVFISDQYEPWPSNSDAERIKRFDEVFDAMPRHTSDLWYLHKHQTVEGCHMHHLNRPSSIQIELNKYFKIPRKKGVVAICPFGFTRGQDKSLTLEKGRLIVKLLKNAGKVPIQILASPQEPVFDGAFAYYSEFFEAIKFCLGCDFVVTVDTAMSWIMSGYQHPVLGLYGASYYEGAVTSKNWQPINPNAIYLESLHANGIKSCSIETAIKKLS